MYKVAIFDLDGVVFESPSAWERIFSKLGMDKVHDRLEERFNRGEFKSYIEWSEAALSEIKSAGLAKEAFDEVINGMPLMRGARDAFEALRSNGIKTAAISGGFLELAERAKKELGIDYVFAHAGLQFDESGRMESWKLYKTDYRGKLFVARFVTRLYSASMTECAYVGDGPNDIPVFRVAGMGIAFNSRREEVKKAANVVIDRQDLSLILPHIGISSRARQDGSQGSAVADYGSLLRSSRAAGRRGRIRRGVT